MIIRIPSASVLPFGRKDSPTTIPGEQRGLDETWLREATNNLTSRRRIILALYRRKCITGNSRQHCAGVDDKKTERYGNKICITYLSGFTEIALVAHRRFG